jgi:heme A synthase
VVADEKPPPELMSAPVMASMVILVNAVLGGAIVTLGGTLAARAPLPLATALGTIAGLALLALGLRHEHRR